MGIFDRLRRLINANVNSALDKAEDPEKMLNQLLVEMNEQLVESKKAVAGAIADEKRLERQIQDYRNQSNDWERRAVLALQESERNPLKQIEYEGLAKQALIRKKEGDEIAHKLQEQLNAQHAAVEKLKGSLKDLQMRIDESQRKKTLLVARAKRAEASRKIQEQVSGMSNTSAFEAFDKMAQKVDQLESEADALLELEDATSGASLEQEFAKLEKQGRGDNLLEDFKREQAAKKIQGPANTAKALPNAKAAILPANSEVDLMMEDLKRKLHGG
jgi:phage shock protein A